MAIDYAQTARDVVKYIGGDNNVISVTHCATRLRFILKDNNIVDKEELKRVKGVITVIEAGGQMQVVIGNHVSDAYKHVLKIITVDENATVSAPNVGIVSRVMDVIYFPAGHDRLHGSQKIQRSSVHRGHHRLCADKP